MKKILIAIINPDGETTFRTVPASMESMHEILGTQFVKMTPSVLDDRKSRAFYLADIAPANSEGLPINIVTLREGTTIICRVSPVGMCSIYIDDARHIATITATKMAVDIAKANGEGHSDGAGGAEDDEEE